MKEGINIYYGSNVEVNLPQIIIPRYYKDFGSGFYCTNHDIIEGSMADDQTWDYVEDFMATMLEVFIKHFSIKTRKINSWKIRE